MLKTLLEKTSTFFKDHFLNLDLFAVSNALAIYDKEATVISIVLPFVYHGFTHFTIHLRMSSFFSMQILKTDSSIVSEPMVNER